MNLAALSALSVALRELRVAARRKGIYRVRFWAAVVAVGLVAWVFFSALLSPQSPAPATLGAEIFYSLASVLMGYSLLAGSRATADCLSEEKRDGTLGLLFLTDLKGYDVVAGKMTANSMSCTYGLLASFPVLTLPLLLGGVSWELVWRVLLILANALFFSLAAGMLASAVCRKERLACGMAFLFVALIAAGLPALGLLFREYVIKDDALPVPEWFLFPSPLAHFIRTLEGFSSFAVAGKFKGVEYWGSLATAHLLGWLFLWGACRITPKSWQDVPASLWLERWRRRWQYWCYGGSETRAALRKQLLDINPFVWICGGRDRLQRTLLWGFLGLLVVGFLYGLAKLPHDWLCMPVAVTTALAFGTTVKYWVAGESTRRCLEIRRDGALELLVCTPMTVREMLQGQWLAMRRLFGAALVMVAIVDFIMLAVALSDISNQSERVSTVIAFISGLILLGADFCALVWVGSWQGLTAKNAKTASGTTAWRILVLPWVLWGMSIPVWGFLIRFSVGIGGESSFNVFILWWLAIGLVIDLAYGVSAYRRLHAEFRAIAAQRYQPAPKNPWWKFLKYEKNSPPPILNR